MADDGGGRRQDDDDDDDNVAITLEEATKAQRGSRGICLLFI